MARQFKLAGKDEVEATKCDIVVDTMQEINEAYFRAWFFIEDEAQKQEAQKVFKAETVPKTLQGLENLVKSYGNGTWAVGKDVTWADLIVFDSIYNLLVLDSEVLDKCPTLKKNREAVEKLPRVAEHLAKRQETPF